MIVYTPFWDMLDEKGLNQYRAMQIYGINSETMNRLKTDKPLNTTSLNKICNAMKCDLHNILKFIPDDPNEQEK